MDHQGFRGNNAPSKVIHVRNLPLDATKEELLELCSPWGAVARVKTSAGPKKDQAFVEFQDLHSAINFMSYYSTGSEVPKVRTKGVFVQYSMRSEVVESSVIQDVASNVLLVHLDNVSPDAPLTLTKLLTVFQAFGNVLKVTCYEKGNNYTVFIQYAVAEVAEGAKEALNGRAIPKFLLGDRGDSIILR